MAQTPRHDYTASSKRIIGASVEEIQSNAGTADEIIGYVDPWIVSPGDIINVKVSSTFAQFQYQLVRLLQSIDLEHAPLPRKEVIEHGPKGESAGRYQRAYPGSYAEVKAWSDQPLLETASGIHLSFYAEPWLLDCSHFQTIISTLDISTKSGFLVGIDQKNNLVVWIGTGSDVECLELDIGARQQRWIHVSLEIRGSEVTIELEHKLQHAEKGPPSSSLHKVLQKPAALHSSTSLLFGASRAETISQGAERPTNFFNGRIDSPTMTVFALNGRQYKLFQYDFAKGISTDDIFDISGTGLSGRLYNSPIRAVRGHDYDHTSVGTQWTTAKYGYGAIHFHDDDLDDAGWESTLQLQLPNDLRSGAYAVEAWDPKTQTRDYITFFVRPKTVRPSAKTCFVFSTFTYLAYANEHMWDETKHTHLTFPDGVHVLKSDNFERMVRRQDMGHAIYDIHSDGSGVVYSSSKRPIFNVRPDYVHWGFRRPREFAADLLMVGFLEEQLGDAYDILTDHDLHFRGVSALANYDVVITGSHPEYPSAESLNAYHDFLKIGGSIMYTGGNGFYWRSVTDADKPHRMEVRRADVGARTHELPAGERYHSLNGELGGLWRSLGRAPNYLFGIGSAASGDGPGVPFVPNQEVVKDAAFSWLWKNISDSSKSLLGVYGLAGGASGDELDRMDFGLGTPSNTVLLARSKRHDDQFMLFNEELIFPMIGTLGSTSELVRSDMVYYETAAGGSVFSVGSINWNNSLAWDGYKNDVAQVTENVLKEFLQRATKTAA